MKAAAANPRVAAVTALQRILDGKQPLDQALEGVSRELKPEDRRLTHAIVLASLRHKGSIEHLLSRYLSRALPRSGRLAQLIILSGAAQLLFVASPAHAVVNEQVSLLPQNSKFRGLVNAVLRRFDGEGRRHIEDPKTRQRDLPPWLWTRWKAAWGAEPTMAMARAQGLDRAPLDLSVKADAAGWAERLGGVVVGAATVRLNGAGAVTELDGYAEGAWWVQDLAAAMPVRLFGDLTGRRVLDACAAPGGKTAQLALAGGKVVALDRSARRLERLAGNLARLKLTAEMVAADLRTYRPSAPFDAILLDAPCSATGTLRRHPDIGWSRSEADIAALSALQSELLDAAAAMLAPGGRLVYCVCSLEPEEGEAQIARLLVQDAGLAPCPLRDGEDFAPARLSPECGGFRTFPHMLAAQGGMDGFFAARLGRR